MTVQYLKDAPPRIFDVHVHYPWQGDTQLNFTTDQQADMLLYTSRRLNIRKMVLLGRRGEGWDATLEAWERAPDVVIPMAHISLDEDGPDCVSQLRERGFRGLKLIRPRRNYDDEAYFPTYERAEELGMPCLFHTGVIGGQIDYLLFHPRDHSLAEEWSREFEERNRGGSSSSARMQAVFLDSIALAFPRLRIIGAHLGYGQYDSAAAVARWRRNVWFDVSGGRVVRQHILDRQMIYREILPEKLLFGSDCGPVHMSREVTAWMEGFEAMGMSADDQDKIFYRNAAAIFGEE